ncbi:hypothetical protein CJ179_36495 [Rhodococcus sp. ACS1]|nr:hypothetical protein CJ179_36495 [Rhodococcus sp. ACS1]
MPITTATTNGQRLGVAALISNATAAIPPNANVNFPTDWVPGTEMNHEDTQGATLPMMIATLASPATM